MTRRHSSSDGSPGTCLDWRALDRAAQRYGQLGCLRWRPWSQDAFRRWEDLEGHARVDLRGASPAGDAPSTVLRTGGTRRETPSGGDARTRRQPGGGRRADAAIPCRSGAGGGTPASRLSRDRGDGCGWGGCAPEGVRLDCPDPRSAGATESGRLDFFQGRNSSRVTVVVTADGRRVNVPLRDLEPQGVSPLDLLRSLLAGLESLLGLLITGSRRENGGTRRDERH